MVVVDDHLCGRQRNLMVPVKNNSMPFSTFIDAIVDILQLYELDVEILAITHFSGH